MIPAKSNTPFSGLGSQMGSPMMGPQLPPNHPLMRLFSGQTPPPFPLTRPQPTPPTLPGGSAFGQGIAQQAQSGAPQLGQSFGQNVVSPQVRQRRTTPSPR